MAKLSNINGKFAVEDTGAIRFSDQTGTTGQILKSNGNSAPTWVDPNTVGTGPWLPLAGGIVSGPTTFQSSLTVGGTLTVNAGTYHKLIATFPSTYKTNLQIGQQLNISNDAITDTVTFAHTGTEAASDFIFTVAGNEKLKIGGNGSLDVTSTSSDAVFLRSSQATTTNVYITNTNATVNNTANLYFAPANNIAGSYIKSTAIEDFSTSANRTSDLRFAVRKDGTFNEAIIINSSGTTKITTDGTEQLILHRSDSSIFENNTIGTIKVTADDPTANVVGGQIQFTGGGTWSSNNYPTNIIFSNDNAGTLTERMRIDSSGRVKINSTASYKLNVEDSSSFLFYGATDATTGSVFRLRSNNKAVTIVDIDAAGNSTFAGTISTVGASTFNLGEGIFTKAVNTSNAISASNFWGYGLYEGASRIGEFSMVRDGSSSVYVGTSFAGQKLILGTAAKTTALTLDSSQNATFAGNVGITAAAYLGFNGAGDASHSVGYNAGIDGVILRGQNGIVFGTGGGATATERMRINSSGNVGIGSTNADSKLKVEATSGGSVYAGFRVGYNGGSANYYDANTHNIRNGNSSTQYVTINSTGVGIGAPSPDFALDIEVVDGGVQLQMGRTNTNVGSTWMGSDSNGFHLGVGAYGAGNSATDPNGFTVLTSGEVKIGTSSVNSNGLTIEKTGNHMFLRASTAVAGRYMNFDVTSANDLYIINHSGAGVYLDSGATSWAAASDESLKENIKPLENVLDKIKNYRCIEYNLKSDDTKGKKIGFIAQDWENDFAPIVNKDKNDSLGMKYTETIPVLLKAIQELETRIKILENK